MEQMLPILGLSTNISKNKMSYLKGHYDYK